MADLYKLTAELLGEGSCAKVQGAVSLQNGKEYAVKVNIVWFLLLRITMDRLGKHSREYLRNRDGLIFSEIHRLEMDFKCQVVKC